MSMDFNMTDLIRALQDADEAGITDRTRIVIDDDRKVKAMIYDNLTDVLYIW